MASIHFLRADDLPVSQDFRHIAERHEIGRADRLFRAAISAFCALTRPSRREINQLEELCLQLYESVGEDSLRFVSAALSDCALAPASLVRRLADERIEVAAPLLLKSNVLSEIDLIAIVGHHGASHARVVAQRRSLSQSIAGLVQRSGTALPAPATPNAAPAAGSAESTRETLRGMMRALQPVGQDALEAETPRETESDLAAAVYEKLRATALSGSLPFFQTALAGVLRIDFGQARALVASADKPDLAHVLKALRLSSEQAFLLVSASFPSAFGHPRAIRDFLDRYEAIKPEEAAATLRLYQADAVFGALSRRAAGNANAAPRLRRNTQAA